MKGARISQHASRARVALKKDMPIHDRDEIIPEGTKGTVEGHVGMAEVVRFDDVDGAFTVNSFHLDYIREGGQT